MMQRGRGNRGEGLNLGRWRAERRGAEMRVSEWNAGGVVDKSRPMLALNSSYVKYYYSTGISRVDTFRSNDFAKRRKRRGRAHSAWWEWFAGRGRVRAIEKKKRQLPHPCTTGKSGAPAERTGGRIRRAVPPACFSFSSFK